MIKREMLTMIHYDAAYTPPDVVQQGHQGKKPQPANQAQHLAYLEQHPYEKVTDEEIQSVSSNVRYCVYRLSELVSDSG